MNIRKTLRILNEELDVTYKDMSGAEIKIYKNPTPQELKALGKGGLFIAHARGKKIYMSTGATDPEEIEEQTGDGIGDHTLYGLFDKKGNKFVAAAPIGLIGHGSSVYNTPREYIEEMMHDLDEDYVDPSKWQWVKKYMDFSAFTEAMRDPMLNY